MSRLIYRLVLLLYPVEVRRRWEEDMIEAFEHQLEESWLDAWSCAFAELFQVALPLWVATDIFALSFVSSSVSAMILLGLIWALGNSIKLLEIYHSLFTKFG